MSSLIIDKKYLGFITNRLKNAQHKGSGNVVLSFTHDCESRDSHKRRGYFLTYKGSLIFKCQHCGRSTSFGNFLKEIDPTLASERSLECFREGVYGTAREAKPTEVEPTVLKTYSDTTMRGLLACKDLSEANPVIKYLRNRHIPQERINELYVAPKFYRWASIIDEVFEGFTVDHPRLIIPYRDKKKNLLGYACRAFGNEMPKYLQLRLDKEAEFIYGIDRVDESKRILVMEGQIDSMMLPNSIAVGNANYGAEYLKHHKDQIVIVPDNDFRRNPAVCAQLKKAITAGYSVCLLPEHWKKDVNAIVQSGIPATDIQTYINKNSKRGLSAMLEYAMERKC